MICRANTAWRKWRAGRDLSLESVAVVSVDDGAGAKSAGTALHIPALRRQQGSMNCPPLGASPPLPSPFPVRVQSSTHMRQPPLLLHPSSPTHFAHPHPTCMAVSQLVACMFAHLLHTIDGLDARTAPYCAFRLCPRRCAESLAAAAGSRSRPHACWLVHSLSRSAYGRGQQALALFLCTFAVVQYPS